MRLLVSVRSAAEVDAALSGGADIVDVKEPDRGALGAPDADVIESVADRVPEAVPLSIALGDPPSIADASAVVLRLMPNRKGGEIIVKVGFSGSSTETRVGELLEAVVEAARPATVVAVAYADWTRASSLPPAALIRPAGRAGARGLLLDTFGKDGGGLFDLMPVEAVRRWVDQGRAAGLLTAVAGSLDGRSVALLDRIRPDVIGVRGAACVGGRLGLVSEVRVRALRAAMAEFASPDGATAKRQRVAPVTPS